MGLDKKVLLYSGGLDSYLLFRLYGFDEVIFFRMGNEDNERELEYIMRSETLKEKVKVIDLPISQFELENKVVPFRNHLMALIAANYGNKIYLGTIKDDVSKDKDFVYKSQIEGILNYFGSDDYRVNFVGYPYSLEMPFAHMMKHEILARFIEHYGKRKDTIHELMTESRSCYHGKEKECGRCKNCVRKYVAFKKNDVEIKEYFECDPSIFVETMYQELLRKDRFEESKVFYDVLWKLRNE